MIDMNETKLQTLAQVQSFLAGTHDIALRVPKSGHYEFIERVLKRFGYNLAIEMRQELGIALP